MEWKETAPIHMLSLQCSFAYAWWACFYEKETASNINYLLSCFVNICSKLLAFITHPLIFEWFYWSRYVTWGKSPDSYHAVTPARVNICPPIFSVEEKHSKRKNFNFSLILINKEGNQTRVIESSDSDSKGLMASAVPETVQKSHESKLSTSLKWR